MLHRRITSPSIIAILRHVPDTAPNAARRRQSGDLKGFPPPPSSVSPPLGPLTRAIRPCFGQVAEEKEARRQSKRWLRGGDDLRSRARVLSLSLTRTRGHESHAIEISFTLAEMKQVALIAATKRGRQNPSGHFTKATGSDAGYHRQPIHQSGLDRAIRRSPRRVFPATGQLSTRLQTTQDTDRDISATESGAMLAACVLLPRNRLRVTKILRRLHQ